MCIRDSSSTAPTASIFAIQNSCINGIVDPNTAYLQISEVTDGNAYHYSTGSIFNDNGGANTYANAINISSATFPLQIVTGLANPTGNHVLKKQLILIIISRSIQI